MKRLAFIFKLLAVAVTVPADRSLAAAAKPAVDFQRDIRPVMSDTCFKCHGFDAKARKAGLRLDVREQALKPAKSGAVPIVPGKPEQSEVVRRLFTKDEDDRMPPRDSHLVVTQQQRELFRRWIAEGALYQEHWSFKPIASQPVPKIRNLKSEIRNPIDNFVLARMEKDKLPPAPPADPRTLIRRLSLDLTGLPPTPEEVESFARDFTQHPESSIQNLATRLLDSPRFGERMAMDWLDAARYSDSNGYFRDTARQVWPWRDWVINAFNRNLPYDQFTIEQLAGDLLPNATLEQKIATGFNRNHMVTGESGIIDEEYRVEYVADRLETTSTVWLGLTVGCCRCHDHKYDPITQKEYYQLFAFFNNGPEKGLVSADDPPPTLDVATAGQRAELEKLRASRKAAEEKFEQIAKPLRVAMESWEKNSAAELAPPTDKLAAHVEFEPDLAGPDDVKSRAVVKGGNLVHEPGVLGHAALFDAMQHIELPADLPLEADRPWSIGLWIKPTGSLNCILSKIEPTGERRGFEIVWQKGQLQINLVHRWVASAIEVTTKDAMKRADWHQVIVSYDGSRKAAGVRVFVDGVSAPLNVARDTLAGPTGNSQPLRLGRRDNGLGYYGHLDELRVFRRAIGGDEAKSWYWSDRLRGILAVAPEKRDAKQKKFLLDHFVERHAGQVARDSNLAATVAREAEETFRAALPKTLVMQELAKPRTAHVLMRGQYDAPGEVVEPNTPAALPPLRVLGSAGVPPAVRRVRAPNSGVGHKDAEVLTARTSSTAPETGALPTRLDFARWLVDPSNPLTARVQVNRLWQQCFGEGLVRTVNDFGSQGEPPTHPELLDWLASEFIRSGWDVKHILRLIVTSATYRQSSVAPTALLHRDPDNRLLARGPRFRLSAEMIRDSALSVSDLLVEKIGGPSVKPYQPPGLWEAVSYDGELTYQADRGDGLWRRSLYTFWKRQAPPPAMLTFDGPTRETCVVRRPRTNTPLQALALLNDETYVEAGRALAVLALAQSGKDDERLQFAFRRVTSREPDKGELDVLRRLLGQQRARFAADAKAAQSLTRVGASARGHELNPAELAAWSITAHALFNLDETVTRR
ncbi:MAG: DUF1553 domain-containing protein [Verrucomicrobia bacterium]|nr:DUF1553 domain-containing protein [Verrucomicrobiota bacterium]